MASTPRIEANGERTRIYVGSDDNTLHGCYFDGGPVEGFPFRTGGDVFSSPWVGELDGTGKREIVFGSDDGCVYVLDTDGRLAPGWPVQTGGYVSASPAVADTSVGRAIMIGSWDGMLYALDHRGSNLPGWPRPLDIPIWSSAAIGDVDGDGWAEIAVATNRLFVFRSDGSAVAGFPARLGGYAVASPAIGDIDGRSEIVVGSDRLYSFRAGGTPVQGFPLDLGVYIWASPILVDVNGDGRPEIVVGDFAGNLRVVDGSGKITRGYPRKLGSRITAAATAADIDGDGYLELVVASSDGNVVALPIEGHDDPTAAPLNVSATPATNGRVAGFLEKSPATAPTTRKGAGPPDSFGPENVRLVPGVPRPFRPIEVHLRLPHGLTLDHGLLHYTLNGRVHPSPLLGGRGRYFALIQPLWPLKSLKFSLELKWDGGGRTRLPEQGSFKLTVGVPGLRLRR